VKRSCGVRTELMPSALVHADEPRLRHALVRCCWRRPWSGAGVRARGDLLLSMTTDDRRLELVITRRTVVRRRRRPRDVRGPGSPGRWDAPVEPWVGRLPRPHRPALVQIRG
jgi:hypothetical protein